MRTQSNGEHIRQLREEKGLTLRELAKLADISEAHMCRLENEIRHGTIHVRQRIAAALGTTITHISKPVPRDAQPARKAA
jgi:transcriptional regulator with XRE-family HTH domain